MQFQNSDEKKQLVYTYLAFMLNGILALSIGSLLPFIRETRGLNYAFAGLLVSLHSVGNLFSSFASVLIRFHTEGSMRRLPVLMHRL